ncbi:MAG: endolytic transglycosylase MltG [Bacillota bacterium]|nr:endolytic transglycosylase MltG [Bacillota bacterium]
MRKRMSRQEMSATMDVSAVNPRELQRKKAAKEMYVRTFIYAMTILLISLILSVFIISVANDALALSKPDSAVEVNINRGASTGEIASSLKDAGVIKYKFAFKIFTQMTKNDGKFKYGRYELNTKMDYLGIITALKKTSTTSAVKVLIPEGKEQQEILQILEQNKICSAADLKKTIDTYKFDYDFLKDIPKRANYLEGYLFPDTYEFSVGEDPVVVIKAFLDNFKSKYDSKLLALTKEKGMTVDQVVTLASVIEREAADDKDRGKVASVFTNRLNSKQYPYLQSCATVQYVLKERKEILSIEDTKIDSPYNTYKYKGLPVGPIASPGIASIKAALNPDKTDYYFFVVNKDGVHTFSKTLAEHNKAVKAANSSRGTDAVIGQ